MSTHQRRQQRAGLIWLGGAAGVLVALLAAIANDRQLTPLSVVLLVLGGVAVVIGSVLGLSTLTLWSDHRRRRARRRARERSLSDAP